MRTTIRLDEQLLEKAKQYALNQGTTFTAVVEDALREKIIKRPERRKMSKVKLKTVSGNGLNPGIDLDDSSALWDMLGKPRCNCLM